MIWPLRRIKAVAVWLPSSAPWVRSVELRIRDLDGETFEIWRGDPYDGWHVAGKKNVAANRPDARRRLLLNRAYRRTYDEVERHGRWSLR